MEALSGCNSAGREQGARCMPAISVTFPLNLHVLPPAAAGRVSMATAAGDAWLRRARRHGNRSADAPPISSPGPASGEPRRQPISALPALPAPPPAVPLPPPSPFLLHAAAFLGLSHGFRAHSATTVIFCSRFPQLIPSVDIQQSFLRAVQVRSPR